MSPYLICLQKSKHTTYQKMDQCQGRKNKHRLSSTECFEIEVKGGEEWILKETKKKKKRKIVVLFFLVCEHIKGFVFWPLLNVTFSDSQKF